MKILIIGSGGREHALAWKMAQSNRVSEVTVAPGNGGTPQRAGIDALDFGVLRAFAAKNDIYLTLVGPEVPLAAGIVDDFQAHGLKIWGPSQAAAQLEASKAFAKDFMQRHHIPTGGHVTFTGFEAARDYVRSQANPIVIKASGLAAGKGVILPETPAEAETALRQIIVDKQFGQAGEQVLVEERLTGPEVSVFAFCDGQTALLMPPAQDHKRAFNNDAGPNTGGMGAYAPAPICPPDLLAEIDETVIRPTLAGLAAEGAPYVGVLYAGLMLTPAGPRVLEFNCRFGDPETQVLLPLLKSDLLEIVERSVDGRLAGLELAWDEAAAATVVLASGGYPGSYDKGKVIRGLDQAAALDGVTLFHAGTAQRDDGALVTAGGRVLNVTGVAGDLRSALGRAYAAIQHLHFDHMHHRTDIGWRALKNGE
jgi:phosphoribosylamine--glycine ligase